MEDRRLLAVIGNNLSVGEELRNYRIAVAATAEYTAFFGGQTAASAAIDDFIADLNGFFEPEAAIHFERVSTTNVIYTSATSDPYTNGDLARMSDENQATLDSVIGNANYDIGHVFGLQSSGGQGRAAVGVVGRAGSKARGASVSSNPQGAGWSRMVAHEISHQFGAGHTFNGCGGNPRGSSPYEPASGSTLMSYAGICGADNLQQSADPVLHAASFEEIQTFIDTQGSAFGLTDLANQVPTVDGGPDHVIPAGTPFELTATASDADASDTLTYSWEQLDVGPAQGLPLIDNGSGPLFRSFLPTTNPTRTFPRLSDLLGNRETAALGELLPSTTRELNFRVTVRDGQGGVNSDDVLLQFVDTGSPFVVTSPNNSASWLGGTTQDITWNVAGTDGNGIDVSTVNIFLSTDGGQTFPFLLAATTNDGSHPITVPNIETTQGRIKVQAVGNTFFDVSDHSFAITAAQNGVGVTLNESGGRTEVVEGGAFDSYGLALNTDPQGTVEILVSAGPDCLVSTDGIHFDTSQSLVFSNTTPQTITVRAIDDTFEEGSAVNIISHMISSSTSSQYTVGTPIAHVMALIVDDELPPVIGLDFDCCSQGAPTNWAQATFLSEDSHNLLRDDGVATAVDLDLTAFGSFHASTIGPGASNIPRHSPSLGALDGFTSSTDAVTATWHDLAPGTTYGVYVFGFERRTGTYSQRITISGQTVLPSFVQHLADGEMQVNDEVGTSARTLKSFEEVVAADASGRITVQINPEPGSAGVSLVGLAIREMPTPPPVNTDVVAPTITGIRARASDWSQGFRDIVDLEPGGGIGYPVPHGPQQLHPLPWAGLNEIVVSFSEDVGDVTSQDVQITGAALGDYSPLAVSYDMELLQATITLAVPIGADQLRLRVRDSITDLSGNELDGEWQDGVAVPRSGDGEAGGEFVFAINVLPGDADQNHTVSLNDLQQLAASWQLSTTSSGVFADFDGSGRASLSDLQVLAGNWGASLPEENPAALLATTFPPTDPWQKSVEQLWAADPGLPAEIEAGPYLTSARYLTKELGPPHRRPTWSP